jgi:protein TonB
VSNSVKVRVARGGALALCGWLLSLGAFSADLQLVSKVDPEFPKEAAHAGETKGRVKARMTVSGTGEVVRVEVLDAQPRRVFDRAVVKTLALWKYNTGADNRQVEIEVAFNR